jgi:hypothetical protein
LQFVVVAFGSPVAHRPRAAASKHAIWTGS